MVAPGVIGVGQNLGSAGIIYSDDIPLQILLEVEGIEGVCCIAGGSVLHPDGRATFVIQVDQQITAPSFTNDLGAVQSVDMLNAIHRLAGTDSVGVVEEFNYRVGFLHLLELTAVPRQGVAVEGFGVTYGVVGACENT